ncbi:hypothetical protein BLOT_015772 [Blomia tropicalis]|nr:hypothetical protein BLOT_015772 [Blomia tropicalis]
MHTFIQCRQRANLAQYLFAINNKKHVFKEEMICAARVTHRLLIISLRRQCYHWNSNDDDGYNFQ